MQRMEENVISRLSLINQYKEKLNHISYEEEVEYSDAISKKMRSLNKSQFISDERIYCVR